MNWNVNLDLANERARDHLRRAARHELLALARAGRPPRPRRTLADLRRALRPVAKGGAA